MVGTFAGNPPCGSANHDTINQGELLASIEAGYLRYSDSYHFPIDDHLSNEIGESPIRLMSLSGFDSGPTAHVESVHS
jgi:hypothetical protein